MATEFLAALDANDAARVARCFADGGTWWVDTGLDRAAGDFGVNPGMDRPWPLHGLMDAAEKTALLASLPERFPDGCRQRVTRSFAGDRIAVLEVEGDGWFLGQRHYTNRYCFAVEVRDGLVQSVREYLDTAHSAAVFDGRNLDRRSEAPEPVTDVLTGDRLGAAESIARRFLDAINHASPDELFAACTHDATWWHDGGRLRPPGPDAPVAEGTAGLGEELEAGLGVVGTIPVSVRGRRLAAFTDAYPEGFTVRAHRVTGDDDFDTTGLVLVEATGHGRRAGGLYQNRYAFVLRVTGGLIAEVREYCDTRHAFDVHGIDRL